MRRPAHATPTSATTSSALLGSGAFMSWHDARIGGTLGSTPEQRAADKDAAEKRSAHAATPTVAHFDAAAAPA